MRTSVVIGDIETGLKPVRHLRVSRFGSGREHWHVVVSATTGLNGVLAAGSFEERAPASRAAILLRAAFIATGYDVREIHNGAILQATRPGTRARYVMTRPCDLRHSR